jgi:hypothetical protein
MYIDKNINIYNKKILIIVMKCIFILYAFGISNIRIIIHILSQNLQSLTSTENFVHHNMDKTECLQILYS